MTTTSSRRTALVAVLLGVLVSMLVALTVGAPASSSTARASLAATTADHEQAAPAAGRSVAHDLLRPVAPVVARATSTERLAPPAAAGMLALALVLATVGLVLGVRRSARPTAGTSWRAALSTRAPPAPATC